MRKLLTWVGTLAVAGTALLGAPEAQADGMPRGPAARVYEAVPTYNWSGIYGGVNAGWIGSDIGWTYFDPTRVVADRPIGAASSDSGILGIHAGLQHQFGPIVAGIEIAASGTGNDNGWGRRPCFNPAFNCDSRHDGILYQVGGRLGWAVSRQWLLYATGGWASMAVETREVNAATGVVNQFSTRAQHDGWYIGGGVEYALTPNVILGLEYQHLDFDTRLHREVTNTNTEARQISFDADVVRARLSFKIGRPEAPIEPLK